MAGIPCLCQNGEALEQVGADFLPALSQKRKKKKETEKRRIKKRIKKDVCSVRLA